MDERIRVTFLIRSLNRGGTERQLAELVTRLDPRRFETAVLTFYPGGPIWDELRTAGLHVATMDKRGRWHLAGFFAALLRTLRRTRPDVLHCLLVEPFVFGLVAGRLAGVRSVFWGVRSSKLDRSQLDWATRAMRTIALWLSRFATLIVANSEAGRLHHVGEGFPEARTIFVPNGIDTKRFRPSLERRRSARQAWGLSERDLVIGLAGRLDPLKGIERFLAAAEIVARRNEEARFVCVGSGRPTYVEALKARGDASGLAARLIWLDEQEDMTGVYPAFDLLCSSSLTEGFSNAIGEAMASGVPCVVTDVGDSRLIVGDTGRVVASGDIDGLAEAVLALAGTAPADRASLGARARQRVVERFGVDAMVQNFTERYVQAARSRAR